MLQKSRKITVLMLVILAIYSIVANYSLVNLDSTYYYIVNPLFWIAFVMILKLLLSETNESNMMKKEVLEYTAIATLIYIGIYVACQFFVEIGKNPYSQSINGIISNVYMYILPILAKEYTRFKLINNVYEKEKSYMAILVTIVYVLTSIGIINATDMYTVAELIFSDILPIIAENCLCSYIAFNRMYKPSMLYMATIKLYWLISPILPKVTWIITAVIDTIIPVILLIYVRYEKSKREFNKNKKEENIIDPKNIVPIAIVVIISLWFATGVFPIKPIAVATGSMEKTLMVGDIAILIKCDADDVEEGDIIQYQKENITVIHRVISKYYENDKYYFITQGDNNKTADVDPVSEDQLLAKELFAIKYLGYPAVLINKLNIFAASASDYGIEIGT